MGGNVKMGRFAVAAIVGALAIVTAAPGMANSAVGSNPTGSDAVWRLRAGLNVAALSCRGGAGGDVAAPYNAMNVRHRALFDSAMKTEMQRHGGVAGFDRHQTNLYNHFAVTRQPVTFCRTAASVATRASAMDSAALTPAAPALLAELEALLS